MGLLIKLKNGDTSLKSLKFGNDRPGGGDSGQPFIKDSIDQPPSITNEDSIIRGGLKAPSRSLEDVSRLSKYFFNTKSANGALFVIKQNLLSRISPKTEASFGIGYGGFAQNVNLSTGQTSTDQSNGFFNAGVYTPLSTLAQAGVNFSGTHLNKQGLDPTGLSNALSVNKYQEVVYKNNLVENNKISGIVPLSLVNKSQRASNRAGRKLQKLREQETRTNNQLNSSPENTDIFTRNRLVPIAPKPFTFLNEQANKLLQKWDKYVDERAEKKLERAETASDQAFNRSDSLYNQVLEEEAAVRYSNRLLNLWNNIGFNPESNSASNSPFVYSYSGGSNSILGIGNTNVRFATKNDGLTPSRTDEGLFYEDYRRLVTYRTPNIFGSTSTPSVSLKYFENARFVEEEEMFGSKDYLENNDNTSDSELGLRNNQFSPSIGDINLSTGNSEANSSQFATWEKDEFNEQRINTDSEITPDFRAVLPSSYSKTFNSLPYSPDNNIETKYNTGNPGQKGDIRDYTKGKINLNTGKSTPLDKVNASYIYKSSDVDGYRKTGEYEDLVPLVIGILNNNSTTTGFRKYMHFRAYINKISDSYKANWKGQSYMGRAEELYRYNSFKRDMSLDFDAVAHSVQELTPMFDKLNFLASSLAPEYLDNSATGRSGYMAGNIAYLTIGDYIVEQPGIIRSVSLSIPKDTTWEIGKDQDGNDISDPSTPGSPNRLPHRVGVSLSFTPIHTFRPQKLYFPYSAGVGVDALPDLGIQKYVNPNRPNVKLDSTGNPNYDQEGIDLLQGNL